MSVDRKCLAMSSRSYRITIIPSMFCLQNSVLTVSELLAKFYSWSTRYGYTMVKYCPKTKTVWLFSIYFHQNCLACWHLLVMPLSLSLSLLIAFSRKQSYLDTLQFVLNCFISQLLRTTFRFKYSTLYSSLLNWTELQLLAADSFSRCCIHCNWALWSYSIYAP